MKVEKWKGSGEEDQSVVGRKKESFWARKVWE
jgi:hypothetical protein